MNILLLLVGLGLIVLGADWLVDGASAIARRVGVSEFVIGLTIVGFGTSCPELVVSLTGAIQGNADITIGNVVGSNIFNILFILGMTAVLMPVSMTDANRRRDIPITLSVSLLLIFCGMNSTLYGIGAADSISRIEGSIFLLIFSGYLWYCFKFDSKEQAEVEEQKRMKLPLAILAVAAGHESVGNGQWTDYTDLDNKSWLNGADHGTTGLSDGDHQSYWNRTKTIMDPCPVGYSVLGANAGYFDNDTKTYVSDEADGIFGLNTSFTYNGVTYDSWWPAAGMRTTHGRMADVGYIGMYFHYDHIANKHGGHGTAFYAITSESNKQGVVTTSATFNNDLHTNHAASLRCVREKQFDTSGNPTIPLRGWGADE